MKVVFFTLRNVFIIYSSCFSLSEIPFLALSTTICTEGVLAHIFYELKICSKIRVLPDSVRIGKGVFERDSQV